MAAKLMAISSIHGSVHSIARVKKLLNDVPTTVDDAMTGLVMANKGLVILEDQRVIMRRDHADMKGKVKLISGGGSGHEPAHASYVGPGMLTAAVIGDVFTAPPSSTILRAIRELGRDHPDGILLIVKNYTGDRLNFGVAMERARNEGIFIKMLVVGEDCSMPTTEKAQGRRGLAGTILIHKLAGGMAEEGKKLEDIFSACRSASMSDMATIAVGLKLSNLLPGMSRDSLVLGEDELELGLGIHGEPGVHKIAMGTTAEIVHNMLEHMLNPISKTHIELDTSCPIAVLINNMGGSSKLEEQVFTMEALKQIVSQAYTISRVYCGTFLTSLETAGFSITILKVKTPEITKYLDAPTSAPGWPRTLCAACVLTQERLQKESDLPICIPGTCPHEEEEANRVKLNVGPKITEKSALALLQVISFSTDALSACEFQLNQFDGEAGDGDTGTTLKRGAEAVKHAVKSGKIIANRPFAMLETISTVLESTMGGTSGALYSIFFAAAAMPFQKKAENDPVNAQAWLQALQEGIRALVRYGRAEVGDRTMLDSLNAAALDLEAAIKSNPDDQMGALARAAAAAEEAAKKTIGMKALIGKASYSTRSLPLLLPDPGAHAVGIWMRALYEGCHLLF